MSKLEVVAHAEELPLSADALERLDELREARDIIDRMIERAVVECRTNAQQGRPDVVGQETRQATTVQPMSWARIAEALGISRQSAWERYRHNV